MQKLTIVCSHRTPKLHESLLILAGYRTDKQRTGSVFPSPDLEPGMVVEAELEKLRRFREFLRSED